MSRTRRILGGTGIAYAHQAAIVIVGLWLTPFLLGRIGQHSLGLWLVAGQLLGYLALMDLGVIAILPREIAFASGQGDTAVAGSQIARLVAQVRRIVRWQLVGLSIVCGLVWWYLPVDWRALQFPLVIVFVAFVALYPSRIAVAVLQGLQELPFLAKWQIVGWVCSTTVTISLVLAGWHLYALVIGWTVSLAIPAGAAMWRARRRVTISTTTQPQEVGLYFKQSLWVSVSQIAQVLLNGSDVLLLGKLLGAAAVVPYACTGKLVTVFANHPQLLMHAAQPALSELRASESRERLATVATALTQAMLMMSGGILVVILSVNHFFVNWWIGPEMYGGTALTVAFAGMMLLRHWNVATIYTLFCFGYERQISLTSLCDGLVTVVLTALFVSWWGPIGAPLGSIAGVLIVSLPFNVRSVAHEMGLPVRGFIATLSPLLVRVLSISAAAVIGATWIGNATLAATLAVVIPIGLVYLVSVLPLAWNGPMGPYLRSSVPFLRVDTEKPDAGNGKGFGHTLNRWLVQAPNTKPS